MTVEESQRKILEVTGILSKATKSAVASSGTIHAETLVASLSRMSGAMLFRSFDLKVSGLAPGTVVLSEQANKFGPSLMVMMFNTLRQLGHLELGEHSLLGHTESTALSQLSFAETQARLNPWFEKTRVAGRMGYSEIAHSAAISTAIQIHEYWSVLDVRSACTIAVFGFVEGTKSVPLPFGDTPQAARVRPAADASPKPRQPWYKLWR